MSKELEYEINNFANLLHKDCMNLMECLKKQSEDNKPILYLGKHYQKVILPYEEYQKMYNRLEAIDNANPSEALKCSLKLYKMVESAGNGNGFSLNEAWEYYKTIKQALLKAEKEPKKYLKWEDLEFSYGTKVCKVRMRDTIYKITYRCCDDLKEIQLLSEDEKLLYFNFVGKYKDNVQLFNDLHLERVEE